MSAVAAFRMIVNCFRLEETHSKCNSSLLHERTNGSNGTRKTRIDTKMIGTDKIFTNVNPSYSVIRDGEHVTCLMNKSETPGTIRPGVSDYQEFGLPCDRGPARIGKIQSTQITTNLLSITGKTGKRLLNDQP